MKAEEVDEIIVKNPNLSKVRWNQIKTVVILDDDDIQFTNNWTHEELKVTPSH